MEPTISTLVDESTIGNNTFFISLDTTITPFLYCSGKSDPASISWLGINKGS